MAGGFGTRLRPLSINIPKPMVPVGNLPMMEHIVSLLAKHGITDITALLYFQPEPIKKYFGDGARFGVNMSYLRPDDDYGTAGAVRMAVENADEPVLVISGDLITDFDLSKAIEWHRQKKAEATILLTRVENPLAFGIVITDEDGRITRFLEKPSWGEAFSDTINTGTYILEPSALKEIPLRKNFDFSQDLYPLMLSRSMRLYGRIMDGYWKDVGNVGEYHRVHTDIFTGKLNLDLKLNLSDNRDGSVFMNEGAKVPEGVSFSGTVILGKDVKIGNGTILADCVIGDRSVIGQGCNIRGTVLWSDSSVGDRSLLSGVTVCRRSRIGADAQLLDDSIVSDDCVIGDGATVKAGCKIWPGKTVDEGAIVSTSIIWGEKWSRELFTDSKLTGLALTELTPEMASRLGAAFGAFLGPGARMLTSRDASDVSRLLRRSLLSGILAAGVDVSDLEALPVPVLRHGLSKGGYSAGLYVRHNPDDFRCLDFILFDGSGLDMPTSKLKKIERNYFGEDFERITLDQIGRLDSPQRILENYRTEFWQAIDEEAIKQSGFKIVIDYSNGSSSQIFTAMPSRLGIAATELNGTLNPGPATTAHDIGLDRQAQLSAIVRSLDADVGFALNPGAEKLSVVDDRGDPLDDQLLLLIVTYLFLATHKTSKIAVPVSASMGVERIAAEHGVEVVRVAENHLAMMEIFRRPDINYVGGTRGGFIFPDFQMGADGLFALVKILESLAQTDSKISVLRKQFERYDRRSISVPCPWSKKGTVMRRLISESTDKERQLIDGIRVFEKNGWVLLSPDRLKASFNILAESTSRDNTISLINRYEAIVRECQKS